MQQSMTVLAMFLMMAIATPLFAQPKPAAKPDAPPPAAPSGGPKVVAEVNFDNTPLDDIVQFLMDMDSSFQAVIVRDPGVGKDEPVIQKIRLKKVSASQIFQIICENYPLLEVGLNEENGQHIHVIRVHKAGAPEDAVPVTRVFRMAEAIQAIHERDFKEGKGDHPPIPAKDAMNQILSAVKAVLALNDAQSQPVVQVHEDTQILIIKGTAAQLQAVGELIAAMTTPAAEAQQLDAKRKIEELVRKSQLSAVEAQQEVLKKQLDSIQLELREREKELLAKTAEFETLKLRMEEQAAKLHLQFELEQVDRARRELEAARKAPEKKE